jgi:hypothetical protein
MQGEGHKGQTLGDRTDPRLRGEGARRPNSQWREDHGTGQQSCPGNRGNPTRLRRSKACAALHSPACAIQTCPSLGLGVRRSCRALCRSRESAGGGWVGAQGVCSARSHVVNSDRRTADLLARQAGCVRPAGRLCRLGGASARTREQRGSDSESDPEREVHVGRGGSTAWASEAERAVDARGDHILSCQLVARRQCFEQRVKVLQCHLYDFS